MLLNYDEVRVGETLVDFFTLQNYSEIQRFVKEPAYPKNGPKDCLNLVKYDELCAIALIKRN